MHSKTSSSCSLEADQLLDHPKLDGHIGVGNFLYLLIGCHQNQIAFACLGTHPQIIFINTKNLTCCLINPVFNPAFTLFFVTQIFQVFYSDWPAPGFVDTRLS